MTKSITVLVGSLRKASYHKIIADNYSKLAPEVHFEIFDQLDKIPYYNSDVHTSEGLPSEVVRIIDSISKSDGVIFLTPEYNYSYPAVVKNVIDWISRVKGHPLNQKKVGIHSGTTGPGGGLRVQIALRTVLVYLDCLVVNKPDVTLPNFADNIDVEKREITGQRYKDIITLNIQKLLE